MRARHTLAVILLVLTAAFARPRPALAQTPPLGTLRVTVVDPIRDEKGWAFRDPGATRSVYAVGWVGLLGRKVQPNMRLKLTACGRRLRRNAQWRFVILIAAPAGRSLSAVR